MRVTPIAFTQLVLDINPGVPLPEIIKWMEPDWTATDGDQLAEFAGRACYESWSKPNPATRDNRDYLKHILEIQHESVLEHASITFYVEGVSRACTHELIRHRHLSYSQHSQRYIDESKSPEIVIPPDFRDRPMLVNRLQSFHQRALSLYRESVRDLQTGHKGLDRKRARSASRAFLPNAQPTAIVVTGNVRAWREVIRQRYNVHADLEIQELAREFLKHLREHFPSSFQDFPDKPLGDVDKM